MLLFLLSLLLLSEVLSSKGQPIKASPQTERYLNPDSQAALRVLSALRRTLLLLSFIIITINTSVIFIDISITIQSLYLRPSNIQVIQQVIHKKSSN